MRPSPFSDPRMLSKNGALCTTKNGLCHQSHKTRLVLSSRIAKGGLRLQARAAFTFEDILCDCEVATECFRIDDGRERWLGARVYVPEELRGRYPYNGTAYGFLQELRATIFELGVLVFPDLPLNRTNHTLAQRDPSEHAYSRNPYLTGRCQSPHQDTPPYPTAFWLGAPRELSATWLLSSSGAESFYRFQQANPGLSIEEVHRRLVPETLSAHSGLLLNQDPGLLLIDNSSHCALYHARTCNFETLDQTSGELRDAPMYAFNEVGLLEHLHSLDERRGTSDLSDDDLAQVKRFLRDERRALD